LAILSQKGIQKILAFLNLADASDAKNMLADAK
jgi:hypothetical protein